MNGVTPPPPPWNCRRRPLTLAVAGLAALVWAGAAVGQTTVTTDGLIGPAACVTRLENKQHDVLEVHAMSSTSVTFRTKAYANLYSALRARAGDSGATSFGIAIALYNGRTGALLQSPALGFAIDSSNPDMAVRQPTPFTVSPKTPYLAEIWVNSGLGGNNKLTEICFMTGGTYTMTADPGTSQTTNGCFSISPRTIQDVRNCWCGRKTNLPLFSATSTPTQAASGKASDAGTDGQGGGLRAAPRFPGNRPESPAN